MALVLPAPATEYLNSEADALLASVVAVPPPPPRPAAPETSLSHRHVHHIPPSEIINPEVGLTQLDVYGKEHERYFAVPSGYAGLSEESYDRLERLVDQFAARAELVDLLSGDFIKQELFAWLKGRYAAKIDGTTTFGTYLVTRANQEVQEQKVAIPILQLAIEHPFCLGAVTFEYYTEDLWRELVTCPHLMVQL